MADTKLVGSEINTIPDLRKRLKAVKSSPSEEVPKKSTPTESALDEIKREQQSAKTRARLEVMKNTYKAMYDVKTPEEWASEGYTDMAEFCKLKEQLEDKKAEKCFAIMMTVNTKKGTELIQLQKCVQKWLRKKCFQEDGIDIYYTYEYHGKESNHIHVHMVYPALGRKFSDWKREAQNTFKTVCNTVIPNCLNLKQVARDNYDQKLDYIKGIKTDRKQEQIEADRQWRRENGIPFDHFTWSYEPSEESEED